MSYDSVLEQVKSLPEECLDDVSRYMQFLVYQYVQNQINSLIESDEVFEAKMEKGLEDVKTSRVTPINKAFEEIRNRFA